MNPPRRLRLEPRPSRIACATIAIGCAAFCALILLLPLDAWASLAASNRPDFPARIATAGENFWTVNLAALKAATSRGAM